MTMSKLAVGEERRNTPGQVLFASLIGTTIEFFDFYIYATAAVLVFPGLFFPKSDPASAVLASLATFGIAFLARPVGSAIFGHFGDRVGRKTALAHLVRTFFAGSIEQAVTTLVESSRTKLSREELDRLAEVIDRAKNEGR